MERSDAREADWAEESSQTIALPQASRKATWRDAPDILKDVVLYSVASVVYSTLLRAIVHFHLYLGMLDKIRENERHGRHIHVNWISLFTATHEEDLKNYLDNVIWHLLWAPVYETLIFVLLWKLARKLRAGENTYVISTAVLFGWLHAVINLGQTSGNDMLFNTVVLLTGVAGAFLAGIYVKTWSRFGSDMAYLACAFAHALDNFLMGIVIFAGVKLSP